MFRYIDVTVTAVMIWTCRLSGWATAARVDAAPLRDFGTKGGRRGGYDCHYLPIHRLNPMTTFPIARP